jgi:hypothetical protein
LKLALLAGALLLAAGSAMPPAHAADAIKPGKWEFSVRLQTAAPPKLPPGVSLPPGVKLPTSGTPVTHTQCIDTEKAVPSDPRQECKVNSIQRSGSTIAWRTTCHTAQGTVESAGNARYSGDTMVATMNTRTPNGSGGSIDTTQHITGRYLGACTK